MTDGWIAVDLDGTLAFDCGRIDGIGAPIPLMQERVKGWLAEGREVRIFTARVGASGGANHLGTKDDQEFARRQELMIQGWCAEHLGQALKVTATKDLNMISLWDDRAIQVIKDTGIPVMLQERV